MKNALFIGIALFIDGLQIGISFGLASLTVGAGGLLQAIPVVGTIVGAGIAPIGILFGMVVDVCLSATFGAGLIVLLAFNGMFYPKYLFGGELFKLIPGIDNLPFFTAMTIMCVVKKKSEEGSGFLAKTAKVAIAGASVAKGNLAPAIQTAIHTPQTKMQDAEQSVRTEEDRPQERTRMELKNSFDGIRAPRTTTGANDNVPQIAYAKVA